ncbi:MAG: universal stress protein [Acidobacteria bacterium]|nr:universal stress protein [Acidobacteriota bacterium]
MANSQMTKEQATEIRRILCPVDFSEFSASVLAYAAAFAKLFGSEVTVLHVFATDVPPAGVATVPAWLVHVQEARKSIADDLHRLVAPLSSTGVGLRTEIAEGDTAAEIVRHAAGHDIDLVVMGTHGRSGFDRLTLGSVAEKVLRKATCPVLTIPPGAARRAADASVRRILCPSDFSLWSEQAMDFALSLAARAGAAVTALHVVETIDARPELSGAMADLQKRRCETELRFLEETNAARAGAGAVTNAVTLGRPYLEILRMAEERAIDLIVMGVRGRGPVDLALFGSTTNHVVRRATCPVVTVRARPEHA